jgi:hypothetical protein
MSNDHPVRTRAYGRTRGESPHRNRRHLEVSIQTKKGEERRGSKKGEVLVLEAILDLELKSNALTIGLSNHMNWDS